MTDTFEYKKRLSEKQFANDSQQTGNETTPKTISEPILTFAKALDGDSAQFVPVKPDQYGLYGWCADGVNEKVKHDGGYIRFGWTIWEWPNVLLTAEFHSVWSDPNGELVDITPKPQGESSIVFVPDASYPPSFNFNHRPTNRRHRLYEEPNYSALAQDAVSKMKPVQIQYEINRADKKGQTLLEWIAQKQPRDLLPQLIDRFIDVCSKYDRKVDVLNPGGGSFSPDREFMDLSNEKMRLLHLVQSQTRRTPKSEA
jgi:hypothetical protein